MDLSGKAYPETLGWLFPPQGVRDLDGTAFNIHGAIRTSGLAALRLNRLFPGGTFNVPVNHQGSRIHLLQGVEHAWGGMPEGAPYAHFVLHYADGKTHRFDLKWGIHGWGWDPQTDEPEQEVRDENTRVGWSMPRPPGSSARLKGLRLYHTVLENPFPDVLITSFDVLTTFYEGNLLLFGFSVDNDPRPLAPALKESGLPGTPSPQSITFTLQDGAGTPLPGAQFSWVAVANQGRIHFPPSSADAQGQVKIEAPRGSLAEICYWASGPEGQQAAGILSADAAGSFPASQSIQLASRLKSIIPTAREAPDVVWRYTTQRPARNWFQPDFDDRNWQIGPAGFGTPGTPGAVARTEWKTSDIWLRREFTLPEGEVNNPQLTLHHDEEAEIYINGIIVTRAGGYLIGYETSPLSVTGKEALVPGTNVIAIHCHQVFGGQYIDAGLSDIVPAK